MTDCYNLRIRPSAEKELRGIPRKDLKKIVVRIGALALKPRPFGCEKLSGADRYRIRHGDYRVMYAINDARRIVEIVKIGHRREVYRT